VKILTPQTDDERENLLRGKVLASRVNDVIAAQTSKRYRDYLHLTQSQFMGEPVTDPADVYRDRELVPRALEAYEIKHGVSLTTGRIYVCEDFPICAVPDAVEGQLIGITVHIRRDYLTYRESVERGVTSDLYRHAIAMMAVTRLPYWLHLQYLELPEQGIRKLHEHDVTYSKVRGDDLMSALMAFAAKSRFRAQSDSEAAA
jgi:hypothetical protein